MLPDSTNPRVMADNIKELNARTLGTTAEVEALQIFDDDETNTGKKWIDGTPIYRRVFVFDSPVSLAASSWNDLSVKLADDTTNYIIIHSVGVGNGGETIVIGVRPYKSANDFSLGVFNIRNTGVGLKTLIVEYVKSAPTP